MSRVKAAKTKKRIKWKKDRLLLLFLLLMFIYFMFVGLRGFLTLNSLPNKEPWARNLRADIAQAERHNYLFMFINSDETESVAEKYLFFSYDPVSKETYMLAIPGETITDRGIFLADAYSKESPEGVIKEISRALDRPVHYYYIIDVELLDTLVDYQSGLKADMISLKSNTLQETDDLVTGQEVRNYFNELGRDTFLHGTRMQVEFFSNLLNIISNKTSAWSWPSTIRAVEPYFETNMGWRQLSRALNSIQEMTIFKDWRTEALPGEWVKDTDTGESFYSFNPEQLETAFLRLEEGIVTYHRSEIKVEVLNGTTRPGIATQVANNLAAEGFNVIRIDNADKSNYTRTMVINRGEAVDPGREVAIEVPGAQLLSGPDEELEAMVTVIVGSDYLVN